MEEDASGALSQKRHPVTIEFQELTYAVPNGRAGTKTILRGVNGVFKPGELTAILGPSGAGKSTLLNVLAGYRTREAGGTVLVNGLPREIRQFMKMSRYIMQEDLLQPGLTVSESLSYAADFKLGVHYPQQQKKEMINHIIEMLRLMRCQNTLTHQLSGGERKRLSIALELVNNPSVIFLDEPTTGLDDSASLQCLSLLKGIAKGGRTVIISIHTPSARIFSLFDAVYIVAEGQCVFQGLGEDIVDYLSTFGLNCPKHFNPADFMIEVSSGEYGDFTDRMVMSVDNGKCQRWNRINQPFKYNRQNSVMEMHKLKKQPDYGCNGLSQFCVLVRRMFLQQTRQLGHISFKIALQAFVGLIIGVLYYKMGNDASKTIFNFGFCFVTLIDFMYIPMLPTLVGFPQEVSLLKREHFNRWYGLNAYFTAMTVTRIPTQILLGLPYLSIAYTMSDQPLEWSRILKFVSVCYLLFLASESFAIAISSRLNIINGIFLGPSLTVPFMLLAVYGMGQSQETIPLIARIAMYGSYLRFALEGLVTAVYGDKRAPLFCPETEIICELKDPRALLRHVGMEHCNFWIAISALFAYMLMFKALSYFLLKRRLKRNRKIGFLGIIGQMIKTKMNLSIPS